MPLRHAATLAAVDLGSNSFHLLVARAHRGQLHVLDRLRERVALADGLDKKKRLTPAAMERALWCLERFGQRLRDIPRHAVRAVGTNTLRQATNSREFLARAQRVLGVPIEVIAGLEEARLIYLGVAHSLSTEGSRRKRLVVDIGGGSTECIVGERFEPKIADSLYMGCVTWTRRHFPDGRVDKGRFERAVLAARVELEPIELRYREAGWQRCLGSSGTILAVDAVLRDTGWSDRGITRGGLRKLVEAVVAARDVRRIALPALTPERASVLPGGLAILAAVFQAFEVEQMTASSGALREGLLHDLIGRFRHEDVREQSVRHACERLSVDMNHARRVERTAIAAFRQVAEDWGLDDEARRHLAWAARLHEIGLSVAHAGYHKHGAYLVENADLAGFSRPEQMLLAALIRSHRRKLDAEVFEGVPGTEAHDALRLCALLRLAVVLNRGRSPRALPRFTLEDRRKGLELALPARWLDRHPLTHADLEDEAVHLEGAGIRLRLVVT